MSMPIERLHDLFDRHPEARELEFGGPCQDCGQPVTVRAALTPEAFEISGGALYEPRAGQLCYKCDACFNRRPELTHFQECEVYSRVVGYLRPVAQWNDGKQAEFGQRRTFDGALA
jgi:hypothetical protein